MKNHKVNGDQLHLELRLSKKSQLEYMRLFLDMIRGFALGDDNCLMEGNKFQFLKPAPSKEIDFDYLPLRQWLQSVLPASAIRFEGDYTIIVNITHPSSGLAIKFKPFDKDQSRMSAITVLCWYPEGTKTPKVLEQARKLSSTLSEDLLKSDIRRFEMHSVNAC